MVDKEKVLLCFNVCLALGVLLGGLCLLGAGAFVHGMDPNALVFYAGRNDGAPLRNPLITASFATYIIGNFPASFGNMFSCYAIASEFNSNTTYKLSNTCILRPSQLSQDAQGTGQYGDEKGFVFPGAPPVQDCSPYIQPTNTETCLNPGGCPSDPNTQDSTMYHSNAAYNARLLQQCLLTQPGRDLFIGVGVLAVATGFIYVAWVVLSLRASPRAGTFGTLLSTLAGVSFALIVMSATVFFQASPAASISNTQMDCASLPAKQIFSGSSVVPVTALLPAGNTTAPTCFVSNSSCDPYDLFAGFKTNNEVVGTCTYISPELMSVDCAAATRGLAPAQLGDVNICQDVDCFHNVNSPPSGAHYTSICCQARRKCCGDSATCTGASTCQWNATTTDGLTNQCLNRAVATSFPCNAKQSEAFNNRLRRSGICFPPALYPFVPTELKLAGSGINTVSPQCTADEKSRLEAAVKYYYATTPDPTLNVTGFSKSSLSDCLVLQYPAGLNSGCRTACFGAVNCTQTIPMVGAPGNCTTVNTLCVPDPALYKDAAVKTAHPQEYCESMNDGTEAVMAKCVADPLCMYVGIGFGVNACVAKDCPGNAATSYYGYQSTQNPPCFAGDMTQNGWVPPNFKVCAVPGKGCKASESQALCDTLDWAQYRISNANPKFYFTPSNVNSFQPGVGFVMAECAGTALANCTQRVTTSLGGRACVVIGDKDKKPVCTSPYQPCQGNTLNQYNTNLGGLKAISAISEATALCRTNSDGTPTIPLANQLYISYAFYALGTTLTLVGLLVFMFMFPFVTK
jgi:hypothetical protein